MQIESPGGLVRVDINNAENGYRDHARKHALKLRKFKSS